MDQNQIVALAQKLLSIPSVTGDLKTSHEVLSLARNYLGNSKVTSFSSNSVPSLLFTNQETANKNFSVILNAHLDTIPAHEEQFRPYEKDGKLYGRGAFDMKAAAAVMMVLFKELGSALPYPLGLQLTTDEEVGGKNGTGYQLSKEIRADFAITGEGSNLRIINGSKGIIQAKLKVNGRTAHGAYPWLGKNAILAMYQALSGLLSRFPMPEMADGATTINVARIETDNAVLNRVPDNCTAYLDIRYNPQESELVIPAIKSLLPEGISFEVIQEDLPHFTEEKSMYITRLKNIEQDITGIEPVVTKAYGGSDARFFSSVGCDAIEFGPIGGGHHGDDEWVDIASLQQYYEILKKFLLSFED